MIECLTSWYDSGVERQSTWNFSGLKYVDFEIMRLQLLKYSSESQFLISGRFKLQTQPPYQYYGILNTIYFICIQFCI